MNSLEADLERARALDVTALADAIEAIGFECTDCGACCRAADTGCESETASGESVSGETAGDAEGVTGTDTRQPHTATVFPDEVRELQAGEPYDWRDVARPVPYGLEDGPDGQTGETFEWALQTDSCGDCTFYRDDGTGGGCTVYGDRPLICRTYPFSVALGGTSQPMGEAVDSEGLVRAHECEGLGREMDREAAEELAAGLKTRAVRELEEAIGVRDAYEPVPPESTEAGVVVHDSEGAKKPDGRPL